MRTLILVSAIVLAGCGQSDTDAAKHAAQGYLDALVHRDAKRACSFLTDAAKGKAAASDPADQPIGSDSQAACATVVASENQAVGQGADALVGKRPHATAAKTHGNEGLVTVQLRYGPFAVPVAKQDGNWKVSDPEFVGP